jgi:uncharacterized LabA/DUF88 family protein
MVKGLFFTTMSNYAFIDSQNLYLGIKNLGWKLDYKRFRVYLKDKYNIEQAYLFIGFAHGNENLYMQLQLYGYICIFKPTLELPGGVIKGNVDAELVLHTMISFPDFEKALIVSGDGDFFCLVDYLLEKDKLLKVLAPNQFRYSSLFKRLSTSENNILDFVSALRSKLEYRR